MIKAATFLALEKSLTQKFMGFLREQTKDLYASVDRELRAGDYDKARLLVAKLSLVELYEVMEPALIYQTHLAMLFGASRVTSTPGTSVVGLGFEKMTVQQIVMGFRGVFQIAQNYLQEKAMQLIAQVEDGVVTIQKVEDKKKKSRILKDFQSHMDKEGESYINVVSSLHTSRVSAYGFTAEASVLGLTHYQINEQLDTRVCPVCRKMHGKKFPVGEARNFLNVVTRMTDPEGLKLMNPWPGHSKEDVEALDDMSEQELVAKRWHVPPYHPRPVSEDTEFLEKQGWKLVKDAKVGDTAFSLNPDTGLVEWVPVVGVIYAGLAPNGRMVHFKSQNADLLVTEHHEQVYLQYLNNGSRLNVKPAGELLAYSKVTIPRGGDWVGLECGMTTEMVQLLALWISDGSVVVRGPNSYYVTIATKKYPNRVKELLEAVTGKPAYIRPSSVECYDTELGKYLHDVVGTGFMGKRIPEAIMEMDQETITLFLNTYLIGDGSVCGTSSQYGKSVNKTFYTASPTLAAQIGELIVKAGGFPSYIVQDNSLNPQFIAGREIVSNCKVYRIRWCISAGSTFGRNGKGTMEFVPYDGSTFCLTLERNHVFYSRRNGKCIWTGNCRGMLSAVGKVIPLDQPVPENEKPEVDKTEFDLLGLRVTEEQVKLWNDSLNGITPSMLLALASGKTPDTLLAHSLKEGKVHSLVDLLAMTLSKQFLKIVLGKKQFTFGLQSRQLLMEGAGEFVREASSAKAKKYMREMYLIGKETGMTSMAMRVSGKDSFLWARRGLYPSTAKEWERVKEMIRDRYVKLPATTIDSVKSVMDDVLASADPADMAKLLELGIAPDLLKDMAWSGALVFNDPAAMAKFLDYLSE